MEKIRKKETPVFYRRKVSMEKVGIEYIRSIKKLHDIHTSYSARMCDLPDLTIKSYTTEYVGEDYVINVIIGNVGCKRSNPTRVYCNAISLIPHPGVNDIRIQGAAELGEIQPGATVPCSFTFKLYDLHAKEVGRIEIIVDPKHEVVESNEFNNTDLFNWPS